MSRIISQATDYLEALVNKYMHIHKSAELIDVINDIDQQVGLIDVETAHAYKVPHRVSAVYIFDESNRLYMQQNAKNGSKYDNTVGGHVTSGETYIDAAMREMQEETGLRLTLDLVSIFISPFSILNHRFGLYEAQEKVSKIVPPTNGEATGFKPMLIEDIVHLINTDKQLFTGGFVNTLREYIKVKNLKLSIK